MIVDDEQGISAMLKDYFEFHGYLVYTASSDTEALKAVNMNPDIILLDINMPDMSGLEVCRRIREYVTCPIIFLTARIKEADAVMVNYESKQITYLDKPISLTKKEFDIIELLTQYPGQVFNKERIYDIENL